MNVNERLERIAKLELQIADSWQNLEDLAQEALRAAITGPLVGPPHETLRKLENISVDLRSFAEVQRRAFEERDALRFDQERWEQEAASR